jgi:hypothetical protein
MKRFPVVLALISGAVLAGCHLRPEGRRPLIDFAAARRRMMERMMKSMPENSPPKLVMAILPRLQEQSDQILALLKEQNKLLRQANPKR